MDHLNTFHRGLNVLRSPAVAAGTHPAQYYGYLNSEPNDWAVPVFLFFAEDDAAMLNLIRDALVPATEHANVALTRAAVEAYLKRGWMRWPTIERIGGAK